MSKSASSLVPFWLYGIIVTDKGFVYLNDLSFSPENGKNSVPHGFTDAMRHKPRRLESNLKRPVELVRTDPFFAGAHEINRLKPLVEGNVAGLENGPDFYGKLFSTMPALPKPGPR